MENLYKLAKGLNNKFPKGNEPYQMATRLSEECGEVASQICHFENSGIKEQKYGQPQKENMAGELKNVLSVVFQIAIYYGVQDKLEASINSSLEKLEQDGHI